MIRREVLAGGIDHALRDYRVVMMDGLPRVGRTSLANRWALSRDDVEALSFGQQSQAHITLHDNLDFVRATEMIETVRSEEWAAGGRQLVVLPEDLATLRLIETKLPGLAMTLRLEPLSLEDCRAEVSAMGPAQGAAPGAAPMAGPAGPATIDADTHWLRGGLPQSLAAGSDQASLTWRRHLLQGLLHRDYSTFSVTEATRLPEVLLELARRSGGEFNEDEYAKLRRPELRSAMYVLERIGLIRRLPNLAAEYIPVGAVQWAKVYVRDSGLLHALLGIETIDHLRNSSLIGDSFEGYAIETLIQAAGPSTEVGFFRAITTEGEGADEIDLILDLSPRKPIKIAIEMKVGPKRRARKGFFRACDIIGANERFVVHSGDGPTDESGLPRLGLAEAVNQIRMLAR